MNEPERLYPLRRVRSFVPRNGRITPGQQQAFATQWSQFGLKLADGMLDYQMQFKRNAPCRLEIGFGMGQSLLAYAKEHRDENLIGIEAHIPGIGALLLGIQMAGLENIRVFNGDAIDILKGCIPDSSLESIHIFFPDPWPKRRHHQRRIIQADNVKLMLQKLMPKGQLHLATDWQDYAAQMMQVLSQEEQLVNLASPHQFAMRSPFRPIVTKFERRALSDKRQIWELQFAKK